MLRAGLIGKDILASRSPWLHEQEARALGFDLTYELFDFKARGLADDALEPLLRHLLAERYCGVNVTHPFKTAVMPLLDEVDENARAVGAVNTVSMRDGRLVGHNTDMAGFRDSFVRGLPGAALRSVLQLGAGGAGAAVASAFLSLGVEHLAIRDIRRDRAEALAGRLRLRYTGADVHASAMDACELRGLSGLVNTTPIGMAAHPGTPIDVQKLEPSSWVVDVVYFPLETQLLRQARQRGCLVLDGSGMVVAQAALAFELMTGHSPDLQRMSRSFNDAPVEMALADAKSGGSSG